MVGVASADPTINLSWSTTGMSGANMYSTALTNFQTGYQTPTAIPGNQLAPGAYHLFLWGQFPADWQNYQIYGLDLLWDAGSNATIGSNVAYRHKWGAQPGQKRWDGTLPILLDGVMAAVTASGILWDGSNHLMEADGTFLIGAAHVTGDPNQILQINLDTRAGGVGKGIACRDIDALDVTDPIVNPAVLTFTPEPLSIVLVLAGLALRRR